MSQLFSHSLRMGKVFTRPQVSPDAGFLQQLKEMVIELFGKTVSPLEGVDLGTFQKRKSVCSMRESPPK